MWESSILAPPSGLHGNCGQVNVLWLYSHVGCLGSHEQGNTGTILVLGIAQWGVPLVSLFNPSTSTCEKDKLCPFTDSGKEECPPVKTVNNPLLCFHVWVIIQRFHCLLHMFSCLSIHVEPRTHETEYSVSPTHAGCRLHNQLAELFTRCNQGYFIR